jgi:hypothetical protein
VIVASDDHELGMGDVFGQVAACPQNDVTVSLTIRSGAGRAPERATVTVFQIRRSGVSA